mmetsp:Transcript_14928/g.46768  ORF Transcript_14928/g.46768 Transcript_14928/m.46768 type:complete len:241 (+) Transcript_14928:747-1469(+)
MAAPRITWQCPQPARTVEPICKMEERPKRAAARGTGLEMQEPSPKEALEARQGRALPGAPVGLRPLLLRRARVAPRQAVQRQSPAAPGPRRRRALARGQPGAMLPECQEARLPASAPRQASQLRVEEARVAPHQEHVEGCECGRVHLEALAGRHQEPRVPHRHSGARDKRHGRERRVPLERCEGPPAKRAEEPLLGPPGVSRFNGAPSTLHERPQDQPHVESIVRHEGTHHDCLGNQWPH